MSMKNSSETIGNRTRDLSACSEVPQPTAPPRTPALKAQSDEMRKRILTPNLRKVEIQRRSSFETPGAVYLWLQLLLIHFA
jgi:hypothetical protein